MSIEVYNQIALILVLLKCNAAFTSVKLIFVWVRFVIQQN